MLRLFWHFQKNSRCDLSVYTYDQLLWLEGEWLVRDCFLVQYLNSYCLVIFIYSMLLFKLNLIEDVRALQILTSLVHQTFSAG